MNNNEEKKCAPSGISLLWVSKGSSTTVAFCQRNSVFRNMKVYTGSVSEWPPWALSGTRHRVSCSRQLCRRSNTLLFSPWPVLQNIVCTSVILPTPWAHRDPPTHTRTVAATITTTFFFFLSLIFILTLLSLFSSSFSLSCSHHRVILFFPYTKI